MASTNLKTDYVDATWSGGLRKYNLINNDDGTVSLQDVTVYTNKEKAFFGAKDANDTNKAINEMSPLIDVVKNVDIKKAGDTISGNMYLNGTLTGGLTSVSFCHPLPVLSNVSGVDVTKAEMLIRQNSKYILGSAATFVNMLDPAVTTNTSFIVENGYIRIQFTLASPLSDGQNNAPIALNFKYTYKLK